MALPLLLLLLLLRRLRVRLCLRCGRACPRKHSSLVRPRGKGLRAGGEEEEEETPAASHSGPAADWLWLSTWLS